MKFDNESIGRASTRMGAPPQNEAIVLRRGALDFSAFLRHARLALIGKGKVEDDSVR